MALLAIPAGRRERDPGGSRCRGPAPGRGAGRGAGREGALSAPSSFAAQRGRGGGGRCWCGLRPAAGASGLATRARSSAAGRPKDGQPAGGIGRGQLARGLRPVKPAALSPRGRQGRSFLILLGCARVQRRRRRRRRRTRQWTTRRARRARMARALVRAAPFRCCCRGVAGRSTQPAMVQPEYLQHALRHWHACRRQP